MGYPSDQLNIDTPELIALELPLAGVGSRFLAITLDTLLQALLYAAIALAAFGLAAAGGLGWLAGPVRLLGAFAPAVLIFLVFCVYWGYFAIFEALWRGQTPGKRYVGIRVIKDSGRPITAFESIGRNLLRAIDGLPGLYTIGLISMVISSQNRRLGDYVAGTVVVHERATDDVRPYLDVARDRAQVLPGPVRVSAEELLLIETYLHRRYDLELDVRTRTAETIAERIRGTLDLPKDAVGNPDTFLEAVAQRTRDGARYR